MRRYSSPQELKLLLDGNINIRVYRELRKEDLRYRASCWNYLPWRYRFVTETRTTAVSSDTIMRISAHALTISIKALGLSYGLST